MCGSMYCVLLSAGAVRCIVRRVPREEELEVGGADGDGHRRACQGFGVWGLVFGVRGLEFEVRGLGGLGWDDVVPSLRRKKNGCEARRR